MYPVQPLYGKLSQEEYTDGDPRLERQRMVEPDPGSDSGDGHDPFVNYLYLLFPIFPRE